MRRKEHQVEKNYTGEFLRMVRKSKNISRNALAEKLEVDIMTLGRWERGECPVPIPVVAALAEILMVPDIKKARCKDCLLCDAC